MNTQKVTKWLESMPQDLLVSLFRQLLDNADKPKSFHIIYEEDHWFGFSSGKCEEKDIICRLSLRHLLIQVILDELAK